VTVKHYFDFFGDELSDSLSSIVSTAALSSLERKDRVNGLRVAIV